MASLLRNLSKINASSAVRQFSSAVPSLQAAADPKMFCFQCEQTENTTGCTTVGVCGKTPDVAGLQDVLIHSLKGISMWSHRARELGAPEDPAVNRFLVESLFSTLTNVNFDQSRFRDEYIPKAMEIRDRARNAYVAAAKKAGKAPETLEGTAATWMPSKLDVAEDAASVGVYRRQKELGADVSGLQELMTYGLKGTAAYAAHSRLLGKEDPKVYASIQSSLSFLGNADASSKDSSKLLGEALKVGANNLDVLAMLEDAHVSKYGNPVPTTVRVTPVAGKCILVSGHDMTDLEQILQATEGTGVNVFTHGELLPAHGYPGLKAKYKHLVGNYGGPWQLQKFEFAKFPGPIVMTTNCIMEPRKSYRDRIYTTNEVGWEGVHHVKGDASGKKDYSYIVKHANEMPGFTDKDVAGTPPQDITVGFGYNTVMSVAGKVIEGVEKGDITRIFFIGGCDGAENERSYFKELALAAPKSSLILTAGCGKYRFNKLDFGTVPNNGLPRLIDMGQCNDSFGAVKVALALATHFKTDINSLPLTLAVSWFEQKAVAILLTLLHLGVKNITLGPNLPAFVGPETAKFLTGALGLRKTDSLHADADMKLFTGAK